LPRKRDIEAAIAAYNRDDRERFVLPPEAARLLAAMFRTDTVCHRTLPSLMAEGFGRQTIIRLLESLVLAGFLSKEPGQRGVVRTYRLHLPPLVRQ
jgi:hypothetical protein